MSTSRPERSPGPTARESTPDPVAADDGAAPDTENERWPRGISRHATMRISDVLAALRIEFPAVTNSKLRFLEEHNLIEPVRTPSGYRQYSPADVERLRYVLREQRDRYLPLKVIGEKLDALDAGADDAMVPRARLATEDGVAHRPSGSGRLTAAALAEDASVAPELVDELVMAGVLRPGPGGRFDPWAREIAVLAGALGEYGIDARHLRAFRAAAERQVDLIDQVVAPLRGQTSVSARAHAGTVAAELGELCARLHTTLVRAGVADVAP